MIAAMCHDHVKAEATWADGSGVADQLRIVRLLYPCPVPARSWKRVFFARYHRSFWGEVHCVNSQFGSFCAAFFFLFSRRWESCWKGGSFDCAVGSFDVKLDKIEGKTMQSAYVLTGTAFEAGARVVDQVLRVAGQAD